MDEPETRQSLIAMIDGDSVKFAVTPNDGTPRLTSLWTGKTGDYPTFIDALQHYLRMHDLNPQDHAFAIAVAGVARGDVVSIAHCRWYITLSGLRAFLRSEPLVMNELAATAWSLTALDQSHVVAIGGRSPGRIAPGSTFLIIGAGVGLGVATLHMTRKGEMVVLESEGGHSSFAPQDEGDDYLLSCLRRQFGHVSYERLLSEPGLKNIHGALAARSGRTGIAPDLSIRSLGRQRDDPVIAETVKAFTGTLGSFAGSMALTVSAWDGIYLTGDLLRAVLPSLQRPEFRGRLAGKGRLSKPLRDVPVGFLDHGDSSLIGAAAALAARHANA